MLHRLDNLHKKALKIHVGLLSQRWLTFSAYSVNADWISAPTQPTSPHPVGIFKKVPDSRYPTGFVDTKQAEHIFHACVYLNFDGV